MRCEPDLGSLPGVLAVVAESLARPSFFRSGRILDGEPRLEKRAPSHLGATLERFDCRRVLACFHVGHAETQMRQRKIGIDLGRPCQLGEGISADTALRLSRYFVSTAEFWMNLQTAYELEVAERESKRETERDVDPREVA